VRQRILSCVQSFDKLFNFILQVISVEYVLTSEGKDAVKKFLEGKGYKIVGDYQLDFLAVRKDYLKTLNIP